MSRPSQPGFVVCSSGPGATAADDRPIRRRFAVDGRVRSGCLTCKARKKKCDGQVSAADDRCPSCIRLGLVCEWSSLRRVPWPSRRSSNKTGKSRVEAPSSPRPSDSRPEQPPLVERPQNTQCPDKAPSSPREGGRGAVEDDHGEAEADIHPPSPGKDISSCLSLVPNTTAPLLLRYFLDHVAPLCSILQQGSHGVCSVFLPMAIVDPSLLYALFTYASVHSDAAATSARSIAPKARLELESRMARGLAEAIEQNTVAESTLACALVASTSQVISGDTSRWLLHHNGAGHLVHHLGAQRLLRSRDGTFLLHYFAYHDTMAALSTRQRPSLEGAYWLRDSDATVDSADPFMGLAHHIFTHIADICVFVALTKEQADAGSTYPQDVLPETTQQAEGIASALRSQKLHLDPKLDEPGMEALVHHAEAFRYAALAYLYRHLILLGFPGMVYETQLSNCVEQIMHHVSLVPLNLFCEMGLLFPLFMLGVVHGDDRDTKQYVRSRLEYIENWTKFRQVSRVRELLDLLWAEGRSDWERMLENMGWNLSLA